VRVRACVVYVFVWNR